MQLGVRVLSVLPFNGSINDSSVYERVHSSFIFLRSYFQACIDLASVFADTFCRSICSFGDLPYLHNTGTSCFTDVARLQSRIPYPFSSHYVPSITSFIFVPSVSFLRILDSKSVSCFPWLSSLELEPVLSRIGLQLAVAVEKAYLKSSSCAQALQPALLMPLKLRWAIRQ